MTPIVPSIAPQVRTRYCKRINTLVHTFILGHANTQVCHGKRQMEQHAFSAPIDPLHALRVNYCKVWEDEFVIVCVRKSTLVDNTCAVHDKRR